MTFTDHKIMEFTHKIADLPDEPTLSPQELKQRFDASPEELRQSVNSICDEGKRLSARVEGIVVDTFGDTIDREMLSDELRAELDGKAETGFVSETVGSLHDELTAQINTLAQRCEIVIGTFQGDGAETQTVHLGFTPKALLIANNGRFHGTGDNSGNGNYYGGLVFPGQPHNDALEIVENGFFIRNRGQYYHINDVGQHYFIAFKQA